MKGGKKEERIRIIIGFISSISNFNNNYQTSLINFITKLIEF